MKLCSICTGNPETRAAVDKMLAQHVAMKKIAVAAGCSKATIGRHSLKCRPRTTAKNNNLKTMTAIMEWPNGDGTNRYFLGLCGGREITPAEARALDDQEYFLMVVRYSPPLSPDQIATDRPDFPPPKLSREQTATMQSEMEKRNREPAPPVA